jgi:hypothetical protein
MEYLIAAIALGLVGLFFTLSRKKKIPLSAKPRIRKLASHIDTVSDPSAKVLEADKVLHEAFKALGSKGSMGDSLKRFGSKLPNEQAVWNAHKLRNRIAHEPMMSVSTQDAEVAVAALLKAVYSLL